MDYNKTPNILKNDHLYHLYTQITGKLNDKPYSDLIDFMHPTPALGGYPKEEALHYIEQKSLVREDFMVHRLALLMYIMIANL